MIRARVRHFGGVVLWGVLAGAVWGAGGVRPESEAVLRGGELPPSGYAVSRLSPMGVEFEPLEERRLAGATAQPPRLVLGWDRVRGVTGVLAGESAAYAVVADAAWRGRTRLERGDWLAAEPLLESVFASVRGQVGPTAAVVSEGLVRCRLKRGAHVLAIEPMLALLRARELKDPRPMHEDWASRAGLGDVVDAEWEVVPSLPPMWVRVPAVEALARRDDLAGGWDELSGVAGGGRSGRVSELARLYVEAARFEAGLPVTVPALAENDSGLRLVGLAAQARAGSPDQRAAARRELSERLRPMDEWSGDEPAPALAPWLEAWLRAALGRSLIRETSRELRQAGVVQLLHIPARLSGSHPYLAGLALAESSATLRELGDDTGADVLVAELRGSYPTHPALPWEPLRLAREPASGSTSDVKGSP